MKFFAVQIAVPVNDFDKENVRNLINACTKYNRMETAREFLLYVGAACVTAMGAVTTAIPSMHISSDTKEEVTTALGITQTALPLSFGCVAYLLAQYQSNYKVEIDALKDQCRSFVTVRTENRSESDAELDHTPHPYQLLTSAASSSLESPASFFSASASAPSASSPTSDAHAAAAESTPLHMHIAPPTGI